jgi:hypothetical protein
MIYIHMNRDDFISIDAIRFGLDGLQKNFRFFVVLMIIVAVLYNLPSLIATYFFKFKIPDGTPSPQIFLMLLPQIFVSMIIYLTVDLGLLRIALKFRDNAPVGFKDLFLGYPLLLKYLVATMIFYLMIYLMIMLPFLLVAAANTSPYQGTAETLIFAIAFLVCLAAAAYLFLKYQFYGYFIVDRGPGPLEALRLSGSITRGVMKQLLIFWVEMILGIAFALFTVSIFIEIPVAMILRVISEDLATLAGGLVNSAIRLFIIVPLTRLATADIYRRLEGRSPAAAIPGGV